ncbi:hypothetical protein [Streptomyces sp. NPDC057557]|uniref:hypothetical protein n=1 Tax=Streptomyces sp. NPDC057557 TaxID=3346167 RepID=UPI0036A437A9
MRSQSPAYAPLTAPVVGDGRQQPERPATPLRAELDGAGACVVRVLVPDEQAQGVVTATEGEAEIVLRSERCVDRDKFSRELGGGPGGGDEPVRREGDRDHGPRDGWAAGVARQGKAESLSGGRLITLR